MIYELVGEAGQVSDAEMACVTHYALAFQSYLNRDWQSAGHGFDAVLDLKPQDTPARLMRDRCRDYLVEPPGDDWKGVFRRPE